MEKKLGRYLVARWTDSSHKAQSVNCRCQYKNGAFLVKPGAYTRLSDASKKGGEIAPLFEVVFNRPGSFRGFTEELGISVTLCSAVVDAQHNLFVSFKPSK